MRIITRRLPERERGSSAIELLGFVPVFVLIVLCILQVVAFALTTQATNQAVRDGARAFSLGHSASAAIDDSLPGGLVADETTYPGGAVRVSVKVPRIAIFPSMTVVRQATMPSTVS